MYEDYRIKQEIKAQIVQITPLIDLAAADDFHHKIDRVRDFIYKNSTHKIDDVFYSHWKDVPLMLEKVKNYAVSEPQVPEKAPHLECSTRSTLIREVLHEMDIRTRSVSVYRQTKGYPGHTFLEVFNPETQRWAVQDADFNIFWRKNDNGQRASIEDLIREPIENFTPCKFDGQCGDGQIEARTTERMPDLVTRFAVASIIDKDAGYRPLLVNTNRFDLEKKIKVGDEMLTYCQHMAKNCRQDIVIYD